MRKCKPAFSFVQRTKEKPGDVSRALFKSPSPPARSSLRSGTRSAEDVACLSFYFINVTAKRRITLIKKARRRPTLPLNAVPSALKGLTSVFDMGTGGSPSLRSPGNNCLIYGRHRGVPLRLPLSKLLTDRQSRLFVLNASCVYLSVNYVVCLSTVEHIGRLYTAR